jgi:hypothetical protein
MELVGHLFEDGQHSFKLMPVIPGNRNPNNPLFDGPMGEIRDYLQQKYGKRGYKITSTRDADHGGFEVYAKS